MSEPEADSREASARRIRDAASVLPFLAVVLLAPPIILIFSAPLRVGGVPLIVLYLFGVWAAVIVAALLLSRRLAGAAEPPPDEIGQR